MAISLARSALITSESTFGKSARLKAGYFQARFDLALIKDDNSQMQCLPFYDETLLCESCKQLGELCRPEVAKDCAAAPLIPDNLLNNTHGRT